MNKWVSHPFVTSQRAEALAVGVSEGSKTIYFLFFSEKLKTKLLTYFTKYFKHYHESTLWANIDLCNLLIVKRMDEKNSASNE